MNMYYTKLGVFKAEIYQERFMGQLHRLKGPAIEYSNGSKCWYQNGELHRLDGPAVEWVVDSGDYDNSSLNRFQQRFEYWIHDRPYAKSQFDIVCEFYQHKLDILV